jgi:hypothetical protein
MSACGIVPRPLSLPKKCAVASVALATNPTAPTARRAAAEPTEAA